MHQSQIKQSKPSIACTSHLTINGWRLVKSVQVCHGCIEAYYKHSQTGWTARELHRGPKNSRIGILVIDENGKSQGLVKRVTDLP